MHAFWTDNRINLLVGMPSPSASMSSSLPEVSSCLPIVLVKRKGSGKAVHICRLTQTFVFNDRFYLSFFVATHGFRESDFDYYSILYLSTHKSSPNVSVCVY